MQVNEDAICRRRNSLSREHDLLPLSLYLRGTTFVAGNLRGKTYGSSGDIPTSINAMTTTMFTVTVEITVNREEVQCPLVIEPAV